MHFTKKIEIETAGFSDVIDVTARAVDALSSSGVMNGLLTLFVPGSTASVTTIEFEPGAVQDLRDAIERIAPENIDYAHDARWGDGNGFSHVRAALMGPSLSVPIVDGALSLGTWQQLVLIDFDNRPRKRELLFQVIGAD